MFKTISKITSEFRFITDSKIWDTETGGESVTCLKVEPRCLLGISDAESLRLTRLYIFKLRKEIVDK